LSDERRMLRRLVRALEAVDRCGDDPRGLCTPIDAMFDAHGDELRRAYREARRHVDAQDREASRRPS
jgi:hypothetical protein